eukprot:1155220-Pelagomonas_calceolata.AAC.1
MTMACEGGLSNRIGKHNHCDGGLCDKTPKSATMMACAAGASDKSYAAYVCKYLHVSARRHNAHWLCPCWAPS